MKIAKFSDQQSFDKKGFLPKDREWKELHGLPGITYVFLTVDQFADAANLSARQVRYLVKECDMPHHGHAHRGESTLRLSESALTWLEVVYRPQTQRGRKFRKEAVNYDDLTGPAQQVRDQWEWEVQAHARLYALPIPADWYLDNPENAWEKRQWKKFREIETAKN